MPKRVYRDVLKHLRTLIPIRLLHEPPHCFGQALLPCLWHGGKGGAQQCDSPTEPLNCYTRHCNSTRNSRTHAMLQDTTPSCQQHSGTYKTGEVRASSYHQEVCITSVLASGPAACPRETAVTGQ